MCAEVSDIDLIEEKKLSPTHDPLAPAVTSLPHCAIIFNDDLDSLKPFFTFFVLRSFNP